MGPFSAFSNEMNEKLSFTIGVKFMPHSIWVEFFRYIYEFRGENKPY